MPDLAELDAWLLRAVYDGAASWAFAMVVLSALGSGWALLATLPFLRLARFRRTVLALLATVITTAAVVAGLKLAVGRSRPCAGTLVARCAPPSDPSFPSGHAAGSFAFAGFVAMAGVEVVGSRRRHRTLTAGLFTLAAGVAASRVALGVHYPTDVAAGALLGTTLGLYGGAWARRAPNRGEDDPGAPCYDDDVALGATELPAEHRSGP